MQARLRRRRLLLATASLAALTALYLLVLHVFHVSDMPGERSFTAGGQAPAAGDIYLEPVSIDALNDAMQMRAFLSPATLPGQKAPIASDRDLTLQISHDGALEEIKLAAGAHQAASIFELDLDEGSVYRYPLDSYAVHMDVQLRDGRSAQQLPAKLSAWQGLLGYDLRVTRQPGPDPRHLDLTIRVRRSGAFALFALCMYGAMFTLAACAVAVLTLMNVCRPEATLVGAIASIAFALPVMRNALPGAPPLGVDADMWFFLWTELVVVSSLALLIFKWARTSHHPA